MDKERWYHIVVPIAHQGVGKYCDIDIYVWVRGIKEVKFKCSCMGGIKRHKIREIELVSLEDTPSLEQRIINDGLPLSEAKRKWYTTSEQYRWW